MTDGPITGSGVEMVEVVAHHNVLNMRYGDRAFLPIDTPELHVLIERGLLHLVVDGEEQLPPATDPAQGARCCGG